VDDSAVYSHIDWNVAEVLEMNLDTVAVAVLADTAVAAA
jgi:hypothetical protein